MAAKVSVFGPIRSYSYYLRSTPGRFALAKTMHFQTITGCPRNEMDMIVFTKLNQLLHVKCQQLPKGPKSVNVKWHNSFGAFFKVIK